MPVVYIHLLRGQKARRPLRGPTAHGAALHYRQVTPNGVRLAEGWMMRFPSALQGSAPISAGAHRVDQIVGAQVGHSSLAPSRS
jgi:hypothetical protein